MLASTALVLLMTPALAFFYGGLVRSKNALNAMMMSVAALGFVGIAWALLGYSLAFTDGIPFIGGLSNALMSGIGIDSLSGTIPTILFVAYQGTFAIITAALISGAIVERMRFSAYLLFITLWMLLIYAPVAHWVWGGGFLSKLGALDFAGGTVVHINAAAAAGVAAFVLKPRKDHGRQAMLPHNVPFVLLGAGLLWFGWFGFNSGSALSSGTSASLAFINTMLAPAATLVVWNLLDMARTKHVTAVGAGTAIVVGLVAITPAAGWISPVSAIALGALAAPPSYFMPALRRLSRRRRRPRHGRNRRRPAHRRLRLHGVERQRRRRHPRQHRPARHPGRGRPVHLGLQRPRHLPAAQAVGGHHAVARGRA
jgi:Amt family ammonium transporter